MLQFRLKHVLMCWGMCAKTFPSVSRVILLRKEPLLGFLIPACDLHCWPIETFSSLLLSSLVFSCLLLSSLVFSSLLYICLLNVSCSVLFCLVLSALVFFSGLFSFCLILFCHSFLCLCLSFLFQLPPPVVVVLVVVQEVEVVVALPLYIQIQKCEALANLFLCYIVLSCLVCVSVCLLSIVIVIVYLSVCFSCLEIQLHHWLSKIQSKQDTKPKVWFGERKVRSVSK